MTTLTKKTTAVDKVTTIDKSKTINTKVTTEFSEDTNKIIIPSFMTKKEAADDLMNQWNSEEQYQDYQKLYDEWEWKDVLLAAKIVMEESFGWIQGRHTMFDSPTEINIVTNIVNGGRVTQMAFAGPCTFAAFEDAKGAIGVVNPGLAYIQIKAKKKFSLMITKFFNDVTNYLATQSIYRGKAVLVTTKEEIVQGVKVKSMSLDLTELKHNPAIFLNPDQDTVVNEFIIGSLTDKGKRTYLFPGNYGNGKSETAINIGVEAIKRGLSFFYVKDSSQFTATLKLAKNYEPCIVFLEDIDEIASGEGRGVDMNNILNTLDGVDTKGRDIVTLFTTNHKDRINSALRRPGRIDFIVEFNNPEKETVTKIAEYYFKNLYGAENLDYGLLAHKMPDASGAVVAEICKRAVKLGQKKGEITNEVVIASITSMKSQVDFMKEPVTSVNEVQKAYETIREFNNGEKEFQG